MVATPDFDRLSSLLGTAKACETFHANYKKSTENVHIDKFDEGFVTHDRSLVFSVRANFCAHTGSYGSSSVYSFGNGIDSKIAGEYAVKAMHLMRKEIFAKMAELMRRDATALEGKARAEIERMESLLASVLNGEQTVRVVA